MHKILKKFFIPHLENDYKPHILYTKRTIFYGLFFVLIKLIVLFFVIILPNQAFLLPDVLIEQQEKIIDLTNDLRRQKNLSQLVPVEPLIRSSRKKAGDMAEFHYFSHTSPDGKDLSYWLKGEEYIYRSAGENLAMGFTTAEEVVSAWIKSPTHYVNLIDKNYSEIGIGIEGGLYQGLETVYVAEHLALPRQKVTNLKIAETPVKPVETPVLVETKKIEEQNSVLSAEKSVKVKIILDDEENQEEKIIKTENKIILKQEKTRVYWQEIDKNTLIEVKAEIAGDILEAVASVGNYPIELKKITDNFYQGKLLVPEPTDNFFRVILNPTLKITSIIGEVIEESISWDTVKIVSPKPFEKYLKAKSNLSSVTNLFGMTRGIYLGFIIFFSLALLFKIIIEIRRQHYHIIAQTVGLIGLLILLFII